MGTKLDGFSINSDGSKVRVSVNLTMDSMDEAKNLLASFTPGANLSGQGSERDDDPPAKPATKPGKTKPKPAAVEVEEEPEAEDEVEEEEEEEEEEEPAKPAPAASGSLKITGEDIKALKEAKKLREVLEYLVKKGVKTRKGLLAACTAIKDKVPCLARIEDLETRVPNAVELLDPSIK